MAVQEQDWTQERTRLHKVRERMGQEIERLEEIMTEVKSDVMDIRRDFWEDVTVNTIEFDDFVETAASIRQQAAVLSQQERNFRQAQTALKKYRKLYPAPYFARIDFTEQGTADHEQIYIGIGSFIDEQTDELLVYDWRAPISGMFYDFTPGPAQFETPGGLVEGEMTLKRQFLFKNGKLDHMFDTGISIGDEMLQYILSKHAHEKMSSIVTTIQQEQNQIIRDDKHQILLVQGAAGSGKTSVALQRVAYLLYKYRNSLSAENMVLFSPNSLFNDYVSNVLPELGEANMQQTTFQDHLERELGSHFVVEDAYDQLEDLLTAVESDPAYQDRVRGIEWKTSVSFLELLNRYIERLKRKGILFEAFALEDEVLVSPERLAEMFYHEFGDLNSISNRIEKMQERLLAEFNEREEQMANAEYEALNDNPRYMGTDEEMKREGRQIAKKAFAPLKRRVKRLTFVNVLDMYSRLFTEDALMDALGALEAGDLGREEYERIGRYTVARLETGEIPYEDATPLLYLKSAFGGMYKVNRIRQVIIDEAQDYTPFQLQYIRRMFPRARFTLLGDLNQGIYHANVQSYQMIGELFGEEQVCVVRLTKSYRSTADIVEFTKHILLQPEPVEGINRSGESPRVNAVESEERLAAVIADGIASLQEQGAQSIAVICKTARESEQAYTALQAVSDGELHLITKKTRTFKSGVVVVPAYLAKGLEFDGVIVYNAGREIYHRDTERKLLYTACTRALHHLYVYHVGELTPFLKRK